MTPVEITVLIFLLTQTAALFYWGGRISAMIKQHDEEVKALRSWKHDVVGPWMRRIEANLASLVPHNFVIDRKAAPER
jgi:hypothetical protein